jgi:O-antigen/teichoic acid export membrane protein
MPLLARRASYAAWWSAVEIACRYGVQFIVMIFLARLLSPQDFGLIAILLIFTSIGALLVDSGFGTALIQRQATTVDDETTVFVFSLGVSLVGAIALLSVAPLIATFFASPRLTELVRITALVLPLGAIAGVPDALLTMRLNFRARAGAEVVASLCSAAAALALAWSGFGVWSLVAQVIVAIAVRASMLWVLSGWRPRGHFRMASLRSLFGFGGYMLLSSLLNAVVMRLQPLLIGKLFNASELGYYTLAQNTQQAPAQLMGNLLTRLGLPVFSTIATDQEKLRDALRASLRIAMFVFVPCMVGIAVVAKPLITLVYGLRWAPVAPILTILALSAALWPIHVLNLAAIGAQGRSNLLLRVEIAKQIVGMALILASSPWGPLAIAWAVLASSVVAVGLNAHYTKQLLDYGAGAQLTDQAATFLLSATAAIVGWIVLHWLRPGMLGMTAAITMSALVYLLLAWFTHNSALTGLLSLLRSLRDGPGAATAGHSSRPL